MKTIAVAALVLLAASAGAKPHPSRPTAELPQEVLAHPAAEPNPSLQAMQRLWSPQVLATWGGPWVPGPGLYDHRYITW